MERSAFLGLAIAILAVLGGNRLEGGHLSTILQPTAALIVFGGTLGAVLLQFRWQTLRAALGDLRVVFRSSKENDDELVERLVAMAGRARRHGLVLLETELADLEDPFLRGALEQAVDGDSAGKLRPVLEHEIDRYEEDAEQRARVYEAAGGYSPTVGILGAVLGLIHVMQNLSDPSRLGSGIATAFVATLYGVAGANLLFLPIAGKLKDRHREHVARMELVLEGVLGLAEGASPRALERRLRAHRAEAPATRQRAQA